MSELQVVVFSLNGQFYGAEAFQVHKIIKYQEPVKVPNMPSYIDGIIKYRDSVVPVIDLVNRFDLGKTEITKKTKIIIAKIDDKMVGFVVNDVNEIAKLNDDEIEAAPMILDGTSGAYLKKVAKKGDDLISIIDLYAVLDSNEVKELDVKIGEN